MKTNKLNLDFQPALKFAGIIGTVGGFVADVLSPLGPILNYLFYLSLIILIISIVLLLFFSKSKKELFIRISLSSFFFSIIFGLFFSLNKDSENGFLGDNVEFIASFQSSLNIIDAKLDEINDKIQIVDEKIEEGFDDIKEITSQTNETLNTISYQQEEVLTSIESLNNIGTDLRDMLGLKTIQIPGSLKSIIENQLKSEEYKNLFTHYTRRYNDSEYFFKKHPDENYQNTAINKIPNTDIGYYRRSIGKYVQSDYDSALKLADSALAVNPKSYLSLLSRALVKEAINDETALEDINKAFALNPNSFYLNSYRGSYFLRKNDFNKAIIDFEKGYELSNFNNKEIESYLMASYWDEKLWSELSNHMARIKNKNELIEYLKDIYGNETFIETWSIMFLLNTNNSADVSYIKSDIVSEIGNVYFGYFLIDNSYTPFYSLTDKNGKYNNIDKQRIFGSRFTTILKPIIDLNRLETETISLYLARNGNEDIIQELRSSQNKEIYTVVFTVAGSSGGGIAGEVFYLEKGIENFDDIEKAYGKKLNISDKGLISNWE
tara:strand:- start:579 stop:2228 length:1650 start_codon:yes stop_codon:yes gene_type:complete